MLKKLYNGLVSVLLSAVLLAGAPPGAMAQGQDRKDSEDWVLHFAPYFWGPQVSGKVTAGGKEAKFDRSFSDIWDNLQGGGMVDIDLMKGRWGIFADPIYMQLQKKDTFVDSVSSKAKLKEWLVDFGAIYRLIDTAGGNGKGQRFDLIAGGRYDNTNVKLTLQDETARLAGGLEKEYSSTKSFTDPIVGARYGIDLTRSLFFQARGDIGGFNVTDTKLTWNTVAVVGWRATDNVALAAGYRALGYEREDKDSSLDRNTKLTLYGPVAGIDFRF
jgi:hypothetical protein